MRAELASETVRQFGVRERQNGGRTRNRTQSGARQLPQFGRVIGVCDAIEGAENVGGLSGEENIERGGERGLGAQLEARGGRERAEQRGGRGVLRAHTRMGAGDNDVCRGKIAARRVSRRPPQAALPREGAAFGRALRDVIERARRRHQIAASGARLESLGAGLNGQSARGVFDFGPRSGHGQTAQFGGGGGFEIARRAQLFAG